MRTDIKKMKMRGILSALTVCLFLVFGLLCFAGCDGPWGNYFDKYDDTGFSVGGASLSVEVHAVEVYWHRGDISFVVSDTVEHVSFSEERSGGIDSQGDDLTLRYDVHDGRVRIHYAKPRAKLPKSVRKDLTVILPAALYDDFNIDNVEGDVSFTNLNSLGLDIETVSGVVTLTNVNTNEIAVETVSGGVLFENCKFNRAEIDTVSGDVTLLFGELFGFRCEFDTVSGTVKDLIGTEKNDNFYVWGDGGVLIEVDTVSGDLTLAAPDGE